MLAEVLEGGSLDRQSCSDDIEGVCEGDRCDASTATADESSYWVDVGSGIGLSESLVDVEASELHSRVWDDTYAVGAIASHQASPSFICPHLFECSSYRELVLCSTRALYLVENLQAFQGRDDCA